MSRQKPQYNSRQVLELAIEVDKTQGFVKSGFGYFDREADKRVNDNKTCILHFQLYHLSFYHSSYILL